MLGQPIQDRHREHEDRPRAFEELGKKLQIYMKALEAFKQKVKINAKKKKIANFLNISMAMFHCFFSCVHLFHRTSATCI